jgi:DedD protein
MPPDLPNEQELNLKKRARRRLVGAIALVLLMVIVLPQVLQDRAMLVQQEAIKITMPNSGSNQQAESVAPNVPVKSDVNETKPAPEQLIPSDNDIQTEDSANPEPDIESLIATKEAESRKAESKKTEAAPVVKKAETKEQAKLAEAKPLPAKQPEVKPAEAKAEQKQNEHFTVQVGVYSDLANVKRLQDQLKQAGYTAYTEKVTTPKGESVRLKAGNFNSRQDAENALEKLKAIGLSGIVIGND